MGSCWIVGMLISWKELSHDWLVIAVERAGRWMRGKSHLGQWQPLVIGGIRRSHDSLMPLVRRSLFSLFRHFYLSDLMLRCSLRNLLLVLNRCPIWFLLPVVRGRRRWKKWLFSRKFCLGWHSCRQGHRLHDRPVWAMSEQDLLRYLVWNLQLLRGFDQGHAFVLHELKQFLLCLKTYWLSCRGIKTFNHSFK